MNTERILTEIRHTRDGIARAAGHDVRKFMDTIRAREPAAAAPATSVEESCILREEPPKS